MGRARPRIDSPIAVRASSITPRRSASFLRIHFNSPPDPTCGVLGMMLVRPTYPVPPSGNKTTLARSSIGSRRVCLSIGMNSDVDEYEFVCY